MDKTFDELFNEFFEEKNDDLPNGDALKKIFETISKFSMTESDEDVTERIYQELGEPTQTIEYIENGFLYIKLIWETPEGSFIKLFVKDVNAEEFPEPIVETKSLEEQLEEALEVEDYIKAIKLRDEINLKKTNNV